MSYRSIYRFVRLFQLCDLARKSSLYLNKICSIGQIFFMTFQFQVSKVNFLTSFWVFLEFFDFLGPDFLVYFGVLFFNKNEMWTRRHSLLVWLLSRVRILRWCISHTNAFCLAWRASKKCGILKSKPNEQSDKTTT